MVDVSITAANVVPATDGTPSYGRGQAGAAITAGQWLYLDTNVTPNTLKLADADLSTAAATVVGVAVGGADIGQQITYQKSGRITAGGTLTKGLIYCLSNTAGGIMPSADLSSAEHTSILGVAESASVLKINIFNSGVTV